MRTVTKVSHDKDREMSHVLDTHGIEFKLTPKKMNCIL